MAEVLLFVCSDIELNYFRCLGELQELEYAEYLRQRDVEDALYMARDHPDFFEERCDTDPHFPPEDCIWWEEIEQEILPYDDHALWAAD